MKTTRKERIEDFFSELDTEIDVLEFVDVDSIDTANVFDSICNTIEYHNGFYQEVVYYSVAIEFLRVNDPSLLQSLNIASEYGYSVESLNSELLASLLKTSMFREEFEDLRSEIEDFFSELEDIEEVTCSNCQETFLEDCVSIGRCPMCECGFIKKEL